MTILRICKSNSRPSKLPSRIAAALDALFRPPLPVASTPHTAPTLGFVDDGEGVLLPDQIAMAVALDAWCIAEDAVHAIEARLSAGGRRGETVVDWQSVTEGRPRPRIVTRVVRERALGLIGLSASADQLR